MLFERTTFLQRNSNLVYPKIRFNKLLFCLIFDLFGEIKPAELCLVFNLFFLYVGTQASVFVQFKKVDE